MAVQEAVWKPICKVFGRLENFLPVATEMSLMKKRQNTQNTLTSLGLVASLWLPCTGLLATTPVDPTKNQAETRAIMAQIFSSLTSVLPLSMDTKEFTDPKNRDKILGDLRKMRDGTSSLVDHTKRFEGSYGFIAKSMSRDIKDIYHWYEKGAISESRYLLQQVTENCVSCHMKLPDPGHAPKMDHFFKDVAVAKLSAPEKARLQVALRQFDDALNTWEDMFRAWPKPSELFAMDTLPEYLKVVIRVKGDMKRALGTLDGLIKRNDLPKFMSREITTWRSSLTKLSGELAKSGQELTRASKMIQNARRTMDYPMDRSGLVDYITASALLNKFMDQKALTAQQTSEGYYLLGVTEALIGRSTWLTQTDYYFEAAVRASPKSASAFKAFDALEQQILMEYSGSGGTNIPEDIQANLEELRGLVKK
jgi:hypothetical protein